MKSKRLQFIKWDGWHGFHFFWGAANKKPAAFHLIYKWSLFIGFWEIRMFLTDKELKRRFKEYERQVN
jgi:hypothetical protein